MSDYTATHTHLSLDDRRIILQGIEKSQTKAEIARFLGKDNLLSVKKSGPPVKRVV